MPHPALFASLCVLCLLLVPVGIQGNDLYVSPNGTPSGPGTMALPYDLATALSGQVGQPGDNFWLTGGNYAIGHINTKIAGAPGQPITFCQMSGERARIDGSLTFYQSTGNVILRDFELYSSDTNRATTELGLGFNPTNINIVPGISSYSPNMTFINLIVHDQTRHGFYVSQAASNNLIYGCVVYNNGWVSPDNAEGHGMYVQGANGGREVSDNIVFSNSGANLHIYENETNYLYLAGITLDGNVAFNAGAIQNVRAYRDWIVGVDAPAVNADRIVFKNNMGYFSSVSGGDDQVQIGRDGVNGSVAILNNYLPQGLVMKNWTIAAVAGNLLAAQPPNYVVNLNQAQVSLAAAWNGNSYVCPTPGKGFLENSNELEFSDWQSATGYDLGSSYSVGNLSGTKIFIRPNRYETGRANIIVYNWDNLSSVPVDVSSLLAPNAVYEVRNAEDFFAAPVLGGVFDGTPLDLPMTGLTVASPTGPLVTSPSTGPTFNVFVLLPRLIRLQIGTANGQVQVSWPTNVGNWVLQCTGMMTDNTWTDITDNVPVVGDRYVVTNPLNENAQFYRLRRDQ
ncbi:MAG: hypothetical protein JWR19_2939 [Pedosphaera sp.]|nr:hypothetical protein [Pedosphaera sp.]